VQKNPPHARADPAVAAINTPTAQTALKNNTIFFICSPPGYFM
jgi:hypothetical protein